MDCVEKVLESQIMRPKKLSPLSSKSIQILKIVVLWFCLFLPSYPLVKDTWKEYLQFSYKSV